MTREKNAMTIKKNRERKKRKRKKGKEIIYKKRESVICRGVNMKRKKREGEERKKIKKIVLG